MQGSVLLGIAIDEFVLAPFEHSRGWRWDLGLDGDLKKNKLRGLERGNSYDENQAPIVDVILSHRSVITTHEEGVLLR